MPLGKNDEERERERESGWMLLDCFGSTKKMPKNTAAQHWPFEDEVLCDVSSSRLPILHASPGFQKMYGQGESGFLDMLEMKRPESLYEAACFN